MGMVRFVVFGFLALSVIYLAIFFYSRSVRREKLEKAWDAEHAQGADDAARSAYIEEGMVAYDSGIRPKLILLVYIVPTVVVATILYITNAN